MISLDLLRQAMQPLEQVGKKELDFDAFGTRLVLRPLLPREEVAVQRYSALVVEENKRYEEELRAREEVPAEELEEQALTRASALDYFDRFRIEVLAYAIVQVGDYDLHGQEHVATGEVLSNGQPVKVQRQVALRGLVSDWSRTMLAFVFGKYGELVEEVTRETSQLIEKSPADLDAEIGRLEEKLAELKDERLRRAANDPGISASQIQDFVGAGNAKEKVIQEMADAPAPPRPAPSPRKSVVPSVSAPPTPPPPQEDLMAAALEEERILQARTPQDPISQAQPAGKVGGMEAYRLPTETLSERGRKNVPQKPATPSTANPNFRPPKR